VARVQRSGSATIVSRIAVAAWARVGAEVGADLLEPRREGVDEGERRLE
jgi:hypothetical protein